MTVLLRTFRLGQFCLAAAGMHDVRELPKKQRISVVDQVCVSFQFAIPHIRLVSGDLRHPASIRLTGDSAKPCFPSEDVLEEKNVPAVQPMRRHQLVCAEIARRYDIPVRIVEKIEIRIPPSIQREETVSVHHPLHRHERHDEAKIIQVVLNPLVAPTGVLPRNLDDGVFQLFCDRRSPPPFLTGTGAVVFMRDQRLIPSHDTLKKPCRNRAGIKARLQNFSG